MAVNNIDKKIRYKDKETFSSLKKYFADEIKTLSAKKAEQLELPLGDNIIPFPYKPGSPILEWWYKSKGKIKNKQIVSIDDLAPYLSNFFSQKQLSSMTEEEMQIRLQQLLEQGLI